MKKLLLITILLLNCNICHAVEINLDAIAMIESSGNPRAWNKKDDSRGLYQITPICLKEFNNFHPTVEYSMDDLWDRTTSKEIASWYLNRRIPQMIKYYGKPVTIENILIAYNAGISYVAYDKPIPEITRRYLEKYFRLAE
jgi:soluble lytic murein transglycosylase-like protein